MTHPDASNTSFNHRRSQDVFLNFRGEDTRYGFAGNLFNALRQKGIDTFMDDEKLERGEKISLALLKAIEESRICIVVFSENYASSTWCLDELVKIIECTRTKQQMVYPVFYKVDPSDVRHQRGNFGKAMYSHENKFKNNKEKVLKWRSVLTEAANFSGLHFKNGYESTFINRIIDEVSSKLNRTLLHVADHPVGLKNRISEVNSLLGVRSDDVQMIGIYGIGGSGKTTIARAVYNLIADQFEGMCFLADVRGNSIKQGLAQLQEALLSEMLGDKSVKLGNINKGVTIIKNRLCHKKVLLVLDDVDKLEQLQVLAGGCDWFGSGSRIIITTRNKRLLTNHKVENTYLMKLLNDEEALELLCWYAFKRSKPDAGYAKISNHVVHYAKGLPLAMKVIGSDLMGKGIDEWKCALDQYQRILKGDILNVLIISYNSLEDIEKKIFLDIACFFEGEPWDYVEKLLHACGFYPKHWIGTLEDKYLIAIDEYNVVRMHDLIRQMGREIVHQESASEPGKRSRLWFHEDVIQVLTKNMGTNKIEGIMLDFPEEKEVEWNYEAFEKMKNLRILIIRNANFSSGPIQLPCNLRLLDWKGFPSPSLPAYFHPKKLLVLRLTHSDFTLEQPLKKFECLTCMDLKCCKFLTKVPDLSGFPNLMELRLDGCENLLEFHDSIGLHDKLVILNSSGCTKLKNFSSCMRMASLKHFKLRNCYELERFPDILGKMESVISIDVGGTAIEELPLSFGNLTGLRKLIMSYCKRLKNLPTSIKMLENLYFLDLEGSPQAVRSFLSSESILSSIQHLSLTHLRLQNCDLSDGDLVIMFSCFPALKNLKLSGNNNLVKLPTCIKELVYLERLYLADCNWLRDIPPEIPPKLKLIDAFNCTSLTSQSSSIFVFQGYKEVRDLDVIVPGTRIPTWFYHRRKGDSLSFWVRDNFPEIIVGFVFAVENANLGDFIWEIFLHINDRKVFQTSYDVGTLARASTDHLWLYDLRNHSPQEEWMELGTYLHGGWNLVKISFRSLKLKVKFVGVHVYKRESKLEDVLFRSPFSNEVKSSFEALKNLLSREFSLVTYVGETSNMEKVLDCLSSLSAEDGIPEGTQSLISQLKRNLTQWTYCYNDARMKLESSDRDILKLEKLEEDLKANMYQFNEAESVQNELSHQLADLERRKKELENEIYVIKANISASTMDRERAVEKKRELFKEGKLIKAQRDEKRNRVLRLRAEHQSAKKTQSIIEAEWSKLQEQFKGRLSFGE
ncbi:Disease resistance protein [Quillaja saponaria]|uniref:Disease resistance protein n=1 Tax=Quillaja saponaria TaxID=32244 RepID=A0AAD7PCP5_QUISA|nr:Disease resistance protein [Quillaja saponaria]